MFAIRPIARSLTFGGGRLAPAAFLSSRDYSTPLPPTLSGLTLPNTQTKEFAFPSIQTAGFRIPSTHTAAVVPGVGKSLEIRDSYPVKQAEDLAPGECLVKLSHTGVCHTDLHALKGDWPVPAATPLVGGHEGVGEIVAIGANTTRSPVQVGDRVGVKWLADSCLNCEFCRKGFEMSE